MSFNPSRPLSEMRIMVTNDDGIDAPGLAILTKAAMAHSDDVWVVAPATNQSAKSRSMTFRQEVRAEVIGDKRYAVHGTPVDCSLIGLNGLIEGKRPDLVLSGINSGGNLADDVGFSGTVGACYESAHEGVPGIALSQTREGPKLAVPNPVDWRCSEAMAAGILPLLVASLQSPKSVLNVNFPAVASVADVKGIVAAPCGWRRAETKVGKVGESDAESIFLIAPLRDNIPNDDDCDLALTQQGYLTITPLVLDGTDNGRLESLAVELAGVSPRDVA